MLFKDLSFACLFFMSVSHLFAMQLGSISLLSGYKITDAYKLLKAADPLGVSTPPSLPLVLT